MTTEQLAQWNMLQQLNQAAQQITDLNLEAEATIAARELEKMQAILQPYSLAVQRRAQEIYGAWLDQAGS